MRRWPPGRSPAIEALRFEVVVGEEVTTRRRPPPGAVHRRAGQAPALAPGDDRRDPRPRRAGDPGPPARPVSPVRPGVRAPPTPGRVRSALPSRRARDVQPDGARAAGPRPLRAIRPRVRAGRDRRQRCARRRGDRHRLDHLPGRGPDDLRQAIEARTTHAHGSFHATGSQVSTFGRQLRKYGRDVRDEVRGRVRRDGTGRDHGYPGGRARPPRYEPEPAPNDGRPR